jgi:hypothetical protein
VAFPPPEIAKPTKEKATRLDLGAIKRQVKISGKNFDDGATVKVTGEGIMVDSVRRDSETVITLTLTVASTATPGVRDLTVSNSNQKEAQCPGCIMVTSPTPCVHDKSLQSGKIAGTAQMATIKNGQLVGPKVDPLAGTYEGLPSGSHIWLIVYSHESRRFYPQSHFSDDPAELSDDRFRSLAYFGGKSGEVYDVLVVFADPQASRSLSSTLKQWRSVNNFRGLTWGELNQLQGELDEKDCVVATLRK